MGRKKGTGEKKTKKTPTKLEPIRRINAGKVTEPWKLMESLRDEMAKSNADRFGHLPSCRLRMFWCKDWKADPDGIIVGAAVCKASELDRILVEEDGRGEKERGETPDVFVKLPKSQWPHLADEEKRHRLFHELCHIRPALDANGKQKMDAKDRPLWRLGRHPIVAFPEEIQEFGIERVIGHNEAIKFAKDSADRPLLAVAEKKEAERAAENAPDDGDTTKPDAWKRWQIARFELPPLVEQFVVEAGIKTIGALQRWIADHGDFWDRDMEVSGMRKPPNFRARIEEANAAFWEAHPEFST